MNYPHTDDLSSDEPVHLQGSSSSPIYYNNEIVSPQLQHGDETEAMMHLPPGGEPDSNYMLGARIALSALQRNWHNAAISNQYENYIKTFVLKVAIVLYVVFGILAIVLLPVTLAVLLYSPGALWQLAVLIPLWAFNLCQKRRPFQTNRLFIEGLRPLDEHLAEDFEHRLETNVHLQKRSWWKAVLENCQESSYFLIYSLLFFALSLIPIVGSIGSAIGETYLVAKSMSWRLMEVYMVPIAQMDFDQRKAFMARHQKLLLGFSLPFTALCALPLGPLLLGYAQASAADLFYQEIQNREFGATENSTV
jgi:hypothetical protein